MESPSLSPEQLAEQTLLWLKHRVGKVLSDSPSPFARWLSPVLESFNETELTLSFQVKYDMLNPMQVIHGGVYAAMLDEVMGMRLAACGLPHFYLTLNLNTDFLYPARLNEKIMATATLVRLGKNLAHITGELKNEEGKLLAKGSCNLIQSRPRTLNWENFPTKP